MAKRPVFIARQDPPFVTEEFVSFQWNPGFAVSQKRLNIAALHENARHQLGANLILEVSTKSPDLLGQELSAFNLQVRIPGIGARSLESAFQGSKVFSETGKLDVAYNLIPKEAKATARFRNEYEQLVGFDFDGTRWDLEPKSWFYDWLYLQGVRDLPQESQDQLAAYQAFTDIEFNPGKSFSCQARSCAIAVLLILRGELDLAIEDPLYLREMGYVGSQATSSPAPEPPSHQGRLL